MKKLLVILLMMPLFASGIRVIGGGGGLGEMEALSMLSQLKILILPCLSIDCGLTTNERQAVEIIQRENLLDTEHALLSFFTSSDPSEMFRYLNPSGTRFAISSNA